MNLAHSAADEAARARAAPQSDSAPREPRRSAEHLSLVVLAVVSVAVAGTVLVALGSSSSRELTGNGIEARAMLVEVDGGEEACSASFTVPRRVEAARVVLGDLSGRHSRLDVTARLTDGRQVPVASVRSWVNGPRELRLPVRARGERIAFCVRASTGGGGVVLAGEHVPQRQGARVSGAPSDAQPAVVLIDRDPPSWRQRADELLGALGEGKGGAGGAATPVVVVVLLAAAAVGTIALIVAGVRRRWSPDRLGIGVALVATAVAAVWAQVTPPLHVADETEHLAYVQYLGETGALPGDRDRPKFSSEQAAVFDAVGFSGVVGRPLANVPTTAAGDRAVDAALGRELARDDGGGPSTASSQPPAYYSIAAVVHRLARYAGADFLTALLAVRLLGALLAAFTAVAAFALVREVLPDQPLAATVAGLAVALQPSVGHLFAAAHPDGALILAATLSLWLAARILRRGATPRRAAALGAVIALGVLTKFTMVFLAVPLALTGLVVATRASWRTGAAFIVALTGPALVYVAWAATQGHPLWAPFTEVVTRPSDEIRPPALREFVSYAWQLYLPSPGFLTDLMPAVDGPAWVYIWVDGFLGRFGWLDTPLAADAYVIGHVILGVVGLLALAALIRFRHALRRRWVLPAILLACAVALALGIAKSGYDYERSTGLVFEQARYLYPLIGVYALIVAVACLAAGRRWVPVVAGAIVPVLILHLLVGLGAVVARYYG